MAFPNLFNALRSLKSITRALHHRNYRLFFFGQSISLIGTWMQEVAVNWLTYRLTHSTVLLGLVGFSSQIPTFVLSPFTGVLADRWDRHHIMVVTQTLLMIQALTLAVLVLTDTVAVWHIIVLSLSLGFINAMDAPSRHSFVIDMIENKDDLGNAIALNSSIFNGARLVGPSIAGILIALVGEGVCFLLNGLSFIAVIWSLLAMKITHKQRKKKNYPVWEGLREGFAYAFGSKQIRSVLFILAWLNLMGISYLTLLPVFARDIFHGGAHTLGFLMAAVGCGALTGGIYLASRSGALGLEKVIAVASGLFGLGLVIFSMVHIYWISIFMMMLIGFCMLIRNAGCNTVLQTIIEEDKRGRMMSLFIMASMGMQPFGSLLGGSLAHMIGTPKTILVCGILCILGAVIFALQLSSFRRSTQAEAA